MAARRNDILNKNIQKIFRHFKLYVLTVKYLATVKHFYTLNTLNSA